MEKIEDMQRHIDASAVAGLIVHFQIAFWNDYPRHVLTSSLCSIGPLQAMIGLAIENGVLVIGPAAHKEARDGTE